MSDADRLQIRSTPHAAESLSKGGATRRVLPTGAADLARNRPQMLDAQSILELQRTVGNQAVSLSLEFGARNPGRNTLPSIQRYEAGEHAQFGARPGEQEEVLVFNGINVTYGEMIAMGDFFERPDQIQSFAKKVYRKDGKEQNALQHLVELIRRDKVARQHGKPPPGAPGPVSDGEWQEATAMLPENERYLAVTARNTAHFAPPDRRLASTGGSWADHKAMWQLWHGQALGLAQAGKRDEAMAMTAYGDHFLTDAFAAGHLFNKTQAMHRTKALIDAQIPWPTLSTDFTDKIAHGILADSTARATLDQYEIRTWGVRSDWYDMNESSMSKVILGIYKDEAHQEEFLSLYANAVHRHLNELLLTGKVGLKVQNKLGKEWQLSGDKALWQSPKTLEYAQEAVAQSRQNVLDAFAAGSKKSLDYPGLIDRVWNWVPEPTAEGQATIDAAFLRYTNPDDPETIKMIVKVSIENLDIMIDKLTSPQINRLRRKRPMPAGIITGW